MEEDIGAIDYKEDNRGHQQAEKEEEDEYEEQGNEEEEDENEYQEQGNEEEEEDFLCILCK